MTRVPLPAFLFVGFLTLTIVGVVLLILCLFKQDAPPALVDERLRGSAWKRHAEAAGSRPTAVRTWIDYLDVMIRPADRWTTEWTTPAPQIATELENAYINRSRQLALDAFSKQSRLSDARVLFALGFSWLIAALGLSANALVRAKPVEPVSSAIDLATVATVPWDATSQAIIVVTVAVFGTVIAYDRLRNQHNIVTYGSAHHYSPYGRPGRLRWLALAPGVYALGTIGSFGGGSAGHVSIRILLVLGGTLASQFALFQSIRLWWQWLQFALGVLLAGAAIVAVVRDNVALGVIAVGVSMAVLELPTLLFASVAWTNSKRNAFFLFQAASEQGTPNDSAAPGQM